MKVQPVSFSGYIRIGIKNKSLLPTHDAGNLTPMTNIMDIANKNKVSMIVGEDILLLSSSQKLQKDLKEANIDFTIEGEN